MPFIFPSLNRAAAVSLNQFSAPTGAKNAFHNNITIEPAREDQSLRTLLVKNWRKADCQLAAECRIAQF